MYMYMYICAEYIHIYVYVYVYAESVFYCNMARDRRAYWPLHARRKPQMSLGKESRCQCVCVSGCAYMPVHMCMCVLVLCCDVCV